MELPLIERYVTIACVSNEVGGDLVGNAKWTGVRLTDVLDMAGVQPGATQIVPRSVDGWTAGFPTAWAHRPRPPARRDDRRQDERRAAAGRARVPGPAHRPGPVRLRVGDEVAGRARAHDARGVRRLLGAARLGEGGADPDPVADRRAALGLVRQRRHRPGRRASRGRPTAAISKVEVRVDGGALAAGDARDRTIGPQTWVQWRYDLAGGARRPPASRSARPTAPARPRRPGHAAGARRRPRLPPDRSVRGRADRPRHPVRSRQDDSTPLPLRHP